MWFQIRCIYFVVIKTNGQRRTLEKKETWHVQCIVRHSVTKFSKHWNVRTLKFGWGKQCSYFCIFCRCTFILISPYIWLQKMLNPSCWIVHEARSVFYFIVDETNTFPQSIHLNELCRWHLAANWYEAEAAYTIDETIGVYRKCQICYIISL